MSTKQDETVWQDRRGVVRRGLPRGGLSSGLLDTLHAVGLLERVVALSTVSGGTIVGAAFALAQARGQSFPAFYREFLRRLHQRPIDTAVRILLGSGARHLPTPTLIAAQAEVYDRLFFHRALR